MNLETSVDAAKTPFGLSLSKGERGFCGVTHWVRSRKPLVLRQALKKQPFTHYFSITYKCLVRSKWHHAWVETGCGESTKPNSCARRCNALMARSR